MKTEHWLVTRIKTETPQAGWSVERSLANYFVGAVYDIAAIGTMDILRELVAAHREAEIIAKQKDAACRDDEAGIAMPAGRVRDL